MNKNKYQLHFPSVALSVTLIIIFLSVYCPEWGYPCLPLEDGPSPDIYGFPLPYLARGASSLHWIVMPHVFFLNILLLLIPVYMVLNVLFPSSWRAQKWLKWFAVILCVLSIGMYLLLTFWSFSEGWLIFEANAAFNNGEENTGYFDLRPVDTPLFNYMNASRLPRHLCVLMYRLQLYIRSYCSLIRHGPL